MHTCCLVPNCHYLRVYRFINVFYLPKNKERRNAWLNAIGRPELIPQLTDKKQRYFVCAQHFGFECYLDNLKLKDDALPRITDTSIEPIGTNNTLEQCNAVEDVPPVVNAIATIGESNFYTEDQLKQLEKTCGALKIEELRSILLMSKNIPSFINSYGNNPLLYNFLQEKYRLPTIEELNNFNMIIYPGLHNNVLNMLKQKLAQFTDRAKMFTLCLEIITLKKHVDYDIEEDRLHGFEEYGYEFRCLAGKYAVVAMLRGIYCDIKIPVGYIVVAHLQKYTEVNQWVDHVVDTLLDIGFEVKAVVTQFKPFFVTALTHRHVNDKNIYITRRNKKIYFIFDVFSLLKSAKHSFMKFDFYYADGKIAKWEHIEHIYTVEKDKRIKLVPNLNEDNLKDPNNGFQVFDSSVANALIFYSELKILEANVVDTANFIETFRNLHDILTLTEPTDENDYNENKRLEDASLFISKLKLIQDFAKGHDDFGNTNYAQNPLEFIRGFLLTINSTKNMSTDLKATENKFLCTKNLTMELFEDFHKNIYNVVGKHAEITCYEFNKAFRKTFVKAMMQSCYDENIQPKNITEFLNTIKTCLHTGQVIHENDNSNSKNLLYFKHITNTMPEDARKSFMITECLDNHNDCDDFLHYLKQNGLNFALDYYDTDEGPLLLRIERIDIPDSFEDLVISLVKSQSEFIEQRSICLKIGTALLNFFIPRFKYERPCQCLSLMFIVKLFARMIVDEFIIDNNEKLEVNSDDEDKICFIKREMWL